ncbi:MAG: hypothetical protein OER87_05875 [Gammaproteobacteria bacterium]|nr:hypothetical protein [Gammaproteobacteria bacterium]
MVEITTMRIWMGVSLAWPLFWILVFDRWFFFSPLGLFIAIGIPVAGWVLWWKFYRGEEQKIVSEGRQILDKSAETLLKLKKRISNRP